MTEATAKRIATLDIVRGVAVMGILTMNIVGFAMPDQAYLNPRAYGVESPIDLASWAFNFVFFDGKMRGLFSFLFGASMLLVIERARANRESEARVHFSRMLWLLLFGYLHFYFIWYGDILTGYATLGMIAWFFRDQSDRTLLKLGMAVTAVQFILFAFFALTFAHASALANMPGATAEAIRQWRSMSESMAVPDPNDLAKSLARYGGDWWTISLDKLARRTTEPLFMLTIFGWEILANLLFGMALLKNGFFTGSWDDASYRRVMKLGLAITIPAYLTIAILVWLGDFTVPKLMAAMAATVLIRPMMVVAIAALIILATRRGGWLVERIAAAGRAAFTNYIGTSIIMTTLFYGYGLAWFGTLGRGELWLVVLPMWALMLAWSKPWLDRFQYGPFEWLWRSLARWRMQPMIRRSVPAEA